MDQIHDFFVGNTQMNYVEAGFSDREAQAMSWLADQKPKGKLSGLFAGTFLAFTWGHWHERLLGYFGIKCNKIYWQLVIVGASVAFGNHVMCSQRYGANELLANHLYVNNNLFTGNLRMLVDNFQVLNRKFTAEEVEIFNQRARDVRSLLNRANKKWIFNPRIQTQEQFERRRKLNISAPWEDEKIKAKIKEENADKDYIVYGPKQLGKLIDETGIKLGITRTYTFGYKPR